jgi:hypothetical protein
MYDLVIARSVPYMISNIGFGTYFVFAACTTLSIIFVYLVVPETKGLTLEQMDVLFGVPGALRATGGVEDLEKGKAVFVERVETDASSS